MKRPGPSVLFAVAAIVLVSSSAPLAAQDIVLPGFRVELIASDLAEPADAAVDRDGAVFVAERAADRVTQVWPVSEPVPLIEGIVGPTALAIPPVRYAAGVYVASAGADAAGAVQVHRVDRETGEAGEVFASIASNEAGALDLVFDRVGDYDDEVFVVDSVAPDSVVRLGRDLRRIGAYPTRDGLVAVAMGRGGDFGFDLYEAYRASDGAPSALRHRLPSGATEMLVEGDALGAPSAIELAPPGSCFGDFVYVLDAATATLVRLDVALNLDVVAADLGIGDDPKHGGLAFDDEGRFLYVVEGAAGRVIRVRPDGPDNDGDDHLDRCDPDDDDDGVLDRDDNCPLIANPLQQDSDGDGEGDVCEPPPEEEPEPAADAGPDGGSMSGDLPAERDGGSVRYFDADSEEEGRLRARSSTGCAHVGPRAGPHFGLLLYSLGLMLLWRRRDPDRGRRRRDPDRGRRREDPDRGRRREDARPRGSCKPSP